jgi:hypothetical protein
MNAHDRILAFCRSGKTVAGKKGIYCMRHLFGGDFGIVDNNYFDPPIITRGDSWEQVLSQLTDLGCDLSIDDK